MNTLYQNLGHHNIKTTEEHRISSNYQSVVVQTPAKIQMYDEIQINSDMQQQRLQLIQQAQKQRKLQTPSQVQLYDELVVDPLIIKSQQKQQQTPQNIPQIIISQHNTPQKDLQVALKKTKKIFDVEDEEIQIQTSINLLNKHNQYYLFQQGSPSAKHEQKQIFKPEQFDIERASINSPNRLKEQLSHYDQFKKSFNQNNLEPSQHFSKKMEDMNQNDLIIVNEMNFQKFDHLSQSSKSRATNGEKGEDIVHKTPQRKSQEQSQIEYIQEIQNFDHTQQQEKNKQHQKKQEIKIPQINSRLNTESSAFKIQDNEFQPQIQISQQQQQNLALPNQANIFQKINEKTSTQQSMFQNSEHQQWEIDYFNKKSQMNQNQQVQSQKTIPEFGVSPSQQQMNKIQEQQHQNFQKMQDEQKKNVYNYSETKKKYQTVSTIQHPKQEIDNDYIFSMQNLQKYEEQKSNHHQEQMIQQNKHMTSDPQVNLYSEPKIQENYIQNYEPQQQKIIVETHELNWESQQIKEIEKQKQLDEEEFMQQQKMLIENQIIQEQIEQMQGKQQSFVSREEQQLQQRAKSNYSSQQLQEIPQQFQINQQQPQVNQVYESEVHFHHSQFQEQQQQQQSDLPHPYPKTESIYYQNNNQQDNKQQNLLQTPTSKLFLNPQQQQEDPRLSQIFKLMSPSQQEAMSKLLFSKQDIRQSFLPQSSAKASLYHQQDNRPSALQLTQSNMMRKSNSHVSLRRSQQIGSPVSRMISQNSFDFSWFDQLEQKVIEANDKLKNEKKRVQYLKDKSTETFTECEKLFEEIELEKENVQKFQQLNSIKQFEEIVEYGIKKIKEKMDKIEDMQNDVGDLRNIIFMNSFDSAQVEIEEQFRMKTLDDQRYFVDDFFEQLDIQIKKSSEVLIEYQAIRRQNKDKNDPQFKLKVKNLYQSAQDCDKFCLELSKTISIVNFYLDNNLFLKQEKLNEDINKLSESCELLSESFEQMVNLLHMRTNRLQEIKDNIDEQNQTLTVNFNTYIQPMSQSNEIAIDIQNFSYIKWQLQQEIKRLQELKVEIKQNREDAKSQYFIKLRIKQNNQFLEEIKALKISTKARLELLDYIITELAQVLHQSFKLHNLFELYQTKIQKLINEENFSTPLFQELKFKYNQTNQLITQVNSLLEELQLVHNTYVYVPLQDLVQQNIVILQQNKKKIFDFQQDIMYVLNIGNNNFFQKLDGLKASQIQLIEEYNAYKQYLLQNPHVINDVDRNFENLNSINTIIKKLRSQQDQVVKQQIQFQNSQNYLQGKLQETINTDFANLVEKYYFIQQNLELLELIFTESQFLKDENLHKISFNSINLQSIPYEDFATVLEEYSKNLEIFIQNEFVEEDYKTYVQKIIQFLRVLISWLIQITCFAKNIKKNNKVLESDSQKIQTIFDESKVEFSQFQMNSSSKDQFHAQFVKILQNLEKILFRYLQDVNSAHALPDSKQASFLEVNKSGLSKENLSFAQLQEQSANLDKILTQKFQTKLQGIVDQQKESLSPSSQHSPQQDSELNQLIQSISKSILEVPITQYLIHLFNVKDTNDFDVNQSQVINKEKSIQNQQVYKKLQANATPLLEQLGKSMNEFLKNNDNFINNNNNHQNQFQDAQAVVELSYLLSKQIFAFEYLIQQNKQIWHGTIHLQNKEFQAYFNSLRQFYRDVTQEIKEDFEQKINQIKDPNHKSQNQTQIAQFFDKLNMHRYLHTDPNVEQLHILDLFNKIQMVINLSNNYNPVNQGFFVQGCAFYEKYQEIVTKFKSPAVIANESHANVFIEQVKVLLMDFNQIISVLHPKFLNTLLVEYLNYERDNPQKMKHKLIFLDSIIVGSFFEEANQLNIEKWVQIVDILLEILNDERLDLSQHNADNLKIICKGDAQKTQLIIQFLQVRKKLEVVRINTLNKYKFSEK